MAEIAMKTKRPSVAIMCFIPDYGHLQPLLKIADALQAEGFDIKFYVADECRPLIRRFQSDCFALNSTAHRKRTEEMTRAFERSIFFNSVCLYLHYLMMYPRVAAEAGNSAERLSQELQRQRPDLLICDSLWFSEWYERIANSLGVPLILNSYDGSLAYSQRAFVRTYGLTRIPSWAQTALEALSLASKLLCTSVYRLRYFRSWLELRSVRRQSAVKFQAAFPSTDKFRSSAEWIVVGTARTERQHLSGELDLRRANLREFPAIRFRSTAVMPLELAQWLESSDLPIVYVSFGSAVDIDERFARAVYDGMRSVEAQVLWSLPLSQRSLLSGVRKADNIRLETFVPQPEILQHPKVKCFVTQGGPHSVQEALFGATPMLCVPFFVDQAYNASVVERLGVGQRLWRRKVCKQSIARSVTAILSSAVFQKNVTAISQDLLRYEGGSALARYLRSRSRASAIWKGNSRFEYEAEWPASESGYAPAAER
jgi:UDP:flavonoid glycosyltransferase YjiC (YdhE family)